MIIPTVASYTVSEYAVVNGTKETDPFATETAYEGVPFAPTAVMRFSNSEAMKGWFTDEACTTAFASSTVLTSNTTLYAKYVTSETKQTVYFSNTGFDNTYVYSFGGNGQFGSWSGTKITTMTNGATFNGAGAVYNVALLAEYGDDKVIFNDGTKSGGTVGTNQTNNLTITNGALYLLTDAVNATGDTDKGSAAKVVYDINVARNAVTANGDILAASICGISKPTATTLVGEYDALTATQKGYVDASTDYTYNSTDTTKSIDVSFTGIISQLRAIASAGGSSSIVLSTGEDDPSFVIVAIIAVTALTAGSLAFALSRKKKKAE